MKIMIGLVLVVIVALVASLVPLISVTYYEDDPYQAQVEKPLSYRETDSSAKSRMSMDIEIGMYVEGFVSIENTDTVPGTFVVDFAVNTENRTITDSDSAWILPGEVKTLIGIADIDDSVDMGDDWGWTRYITPGTKTVTETRYRSVAYEKKVTILDYLLNY